MVPLRSGTLRTIAAAWHGLRVAAMPLEAFLLRPFMVSSWVTLGSGGRVLGQSGGGRSQDIISTAWHGSGVAAMPLGAFFASFMESPEGTLGLGGGLVAVGRWLILGPRRTVELDGKTVLLSWAS